MVLYLLRLAEADSMTNDSARYPEIEVLESLLELGHQTLPRRRSSTRQAVPLGRQVRPETIRHRW